MSIFEELHRTVLSRSHEHTISLAERFAAALPPDATVGLEGDLGSGKTTFVQGMARQWGIDEPVTSPTYNFFTIYSGNRQLVHFDAYRLSSPKDFESLMIEDFLRTPFCLVVEWPEKVSDHLPEQRWTLRLSCRSEQRRTIALITRPGL